MDEDVRRRDFTINALYYDPLKEQVIDYVGGVKDIRNRKLVPVIPLADIFGDDPVRMIRAAKYAVSTGCVIPSKVGRVMLRQSHLLQPVSPSRLTEELIKILHSGRACDTIAMLLRYDLFMYLQPAACSLMDDNPEFARGYRKGLEDLDALVASGEDIRLGRKLVFLITGLVQLVTDWDGHPVEVYTNVYRECRRFIMPMNPPRAELEFAVRFCLKEGGIPIRAARSRGKKRPQQDNRDRPGETGQGRRRRKAPIQAST